MLARIERTCDCVSERLAFLGVIGILVIAIMIVGDVLLRWLFSAPIRGMNEIIEIILAVAIAAVFASGVCRRVHLSIDLLAPKMPHRMGDWLVVMGDVVLFAVFAWSMGYSAVWWGVIMLIVVEAGNISPPFGLNMFVLKTLMPDVPMGTVFKGVMPFFFAALVGLALCVIFPALITWLPASMPK